jgi:hypothetical protein
MNRFRYPLKTEILSVDLSDRPCQLLSDFQYIPKSMDGPPVIVVPAGYRTDFASVPRFFWRIFPPMGRYTYAAVIHDWLCDEKIESNKYAAEIFLECMEALGVSKWRRLTMYKSVLLFGPKY